MSLLSTAGAVGGAMVGGPAGAAVGKQFGSAVSGNENAPQSNTDGVKSSMNGTSQQSQSIAPANVSGSESNKYMDQAIDSAFTKGLNSVLYPQKTGSQLGKEQRDYMQSAYPELNPWERAGASATQAGVQAGTNKNASDMLKMQLNNQKEIAEINAKTSKEVAGIQSITSRQNTKDQVYAQNEMLESNIKKLGAEATNIMQQTNLSTTQQSKMMVEMVTEQLKQQGIKLTNEQIPVLTSKIQEEIKKLKYGKSFVGATASDATNIISGAISEVVPEFNKAADWVKGRFDMFKKGEGVLR